MKSGAGGGTNAAFASDTSATARTRRRGATPFCELWRPLPRDASDPSLRPAPGVSAARDAPPAAAAMGTARAAPAISDGVLAELRGFVVKSGVLTTVRSVPAALRGRLALALGRNLCHGPAVFSVLAALVLQGGAVTDARLVTLEAGGAGITDGAAWRARKRVQKIQDRHQNIMRLVAAGKLSKAAEMLLAPAAAPVFDAAAEMDRVFVATVERPPAVGCLRTPAGRSVIRDMVAGGDAAAWSAVVQRALKKSKDPAQARLVFAWRTSASWLGAAARRWRRGSPTPWTRSLADKTLI